MEIFLRNKSYSLTIKQFSPSNVHKFLFLSSPDCVSVETMFARLYENFLNLTWFKFVVMITFQKLLFVYLYFML